MRGNASAARGRFQRAGQYGGSDHPCRDSGFVQPVVAADGAGITASRGMKSLQPAPLLNFIDKRRSHRREQSSHAAEKFRQELRK